MYVLKKIWFELKFTKRTLAASIELVPSLILPIEIVRSTVYQTKANKFVDNYSLTGGSNGLPNDSNLFEQTIISNIRNFELSSLDSITTNKEELYKFFCSNFNIQFDEGITDFEVLYNLAADCKSGKIKTQEQLKKALQTRGGQFDCQIFWQLLIIIILIVMLNNDVGPGKPLPHLEQLINSINSPKNNKDLIAYTIKEPAFILPRGTDTCSRGRDETSVICAAEEANNLNPIYPRRVRGKLHDGTNMFGSIRHLRGKSYHIPTFVPDEVIKALGGNLQELKSWEKGISPDGSLSQFNPEQREEFFKQRTKYFNNRNKVPPALVYAFAKSLIDAASNPNVRIEDAVMGDNETPGSAIINDEEQKVIFRNKKGELRSGVKLKGNEEKGQWSRFLKSNENGTKPYALFTGNKKK